MEIESPAFTDLDLDGFLDDATHASPAELVAATQTAHRRKLDWLREVRIEDLTRRVRIGEGRHFSAEEIIRLGLCAHIEMHLEQIEQALGPHPPAAQPGQGSARGCLCVWAL